MFSRRSPSSPTSLSCVKEALDDVRSTPILLCFLRAESGSLEDMSSSWEVIDAHHRLVSFLSQGSWQD